MKRIIQALFLILLFLLPLVNSRGLYFIGLDFSYPVSGNFEFTKVMFFNIYSSLLLLLTFICIFINKIKLLINKKLLLLLVLIYILFFISSVFSLNPYVSIFGDTSKAHNFIMFNNLIGIFLIFKVIFEYKFIIKIINTLLMSGIAISIIGLLEYYFPTYSYGLLLDRGIATFGHPNYLSIYLLSIIILFIGKIDKKNIIFMLPLLLLVIISFLLTKSLIAIFLFVSYLVYLPLSRLNIKGKKYTYLSTITFLSFIIFISILFFIPEKLSSFISRFYIWKTVLLTIFDNIYIFLIGGGFETLGLIFDKYKVIELYIYENLGYSADRPHNLLLNFFYHLGIFGLFFISYLYYFVIKNFKNNSINISLLLIFIFLLFNFASIVTYLLITVLFGITLFSKVDQGIDYNSIYLYIIITFVSIFGLVYSYLLYKAEIYAYAGNYEKAINNYSYNLKYNYMVLDDNFIYNVNKNYYYKDYFIYKIQNNINLDISCLEFTVTYNIPEAFFYCGDIYWYKNDKNKANIYYNKGLELLPDLWNKDSNYYNNIIIKNIIGGDRFTSDRYGLSKVLDRMNIDYK